MQLYQDQFVHFQSQECSWDGKVRDRDHIPVTKISWKFIRNFFSNPVQRQTDKQSWIHNLLGGDNELYQYRRNTRDTSMCVCVCVFVMV